MAAKKKMKLRNYEDFRAELLTPEQLREVDRQVEADLEAERRLGRLPEPDSNE